MSKVVDQAEARALAALGVALNRENLECYFDGTNGTRDDARRAHDAAEAAIRTLADLARDREAM